MIELAIKAGLPLISTTTTDMVHVGKVLSYVSGKAVKKLNTLNGQVLGKQIVGPEVLYYTSSNDLASHENLYEQFAKAHCTLVFLNPAKPNPYVHEAGPLNTPPEMVEKFLEKYAKPENVAPIMAAFQGLTLKEVIELSKLAMTKHGEFTPEAARDVRRGFMGDFKGLTTINTEDPFYEPVSALSVWCDYEGRFFTDKAPSFLVPRGLLFSGPPGTGKTAGAKYIARQTNCTLFLAEIGLLMGRYVGESEKALEEALRRAESMSPCILLFDEVEKLFQGTSDSGVTQRLLGMLLWWLQEHRSMVFTIMTTNHRDRIPPELIRVGRLDGEVGFYGMGDAEALDFARKTAWKMIDAADLGSAPKTIFEDEIKNLLINHEAPHTYAEVVNFVQKFLKNYLLTNALL